MLMAVSHMALCSHPHVNPSPSALLKWFGYHISPKTLPFNSLSTWILISRILVFGYHNLPIRAPYDTIFYLKYSINHKLSSCETAPWCSWCTIHLFLQIRSFHCNSVSQTRVRANGPILSKATLSLMCVRIKASWVTLETGNGNKCPVTMAIGTRHCQRGNLTHAGRLLCLVKDYLVFADLSCH